MRQWLVIAGLLLTGATAMAQVAPPAPAAAVPATAVDPVSIDASRLGVSLARIQKGLRIKPSSETVSSTGLKLSFQVQVFGTAPRIDIIKDFDIVHGPTPNSAPTHRDILDHLTPQAFRAPAFPVSSAVVWMAQQLWSKGQKSRCEQEIADYRAMVMQGISVSAPSCAR